MYQNHYFEVRGRYGYKSQDSCDSNAEPIDMTTSRSYRTVIVAKEE